MFLVLMGFVLGVYILEHMNLPYIELYNGFIQNTNIYCDRQYLSRASGRHLT